MEYFDINIAGCDRKLPICALNEKISIAAFVMFGDVEITEKSAEMLLQKSPEFDVILTAEAKSIPLAYEMSKQSGKQYVVARKDIKVYVINPLTVDVKTITTRKNQQLHLSQENVETLKGKRVLIVDDVISTGKSLIALEKLCELSQATVVAKCAVLAEGDAVNRDDIIYLEKLPIISND